jgi:3-oxoacyl-[acyl-carrier-protein] synthase-3
MNFTFKNKKISGILTILPRQESRFDDELGNYNFPPEKSMRLKKIMGYDRHRLVDDNTCVSDLVAFGLQYLFDEGFVRRDEIDAMILVTQTPDYLMPPTTSIVHGRLGMKQDMICLDINQGCAGFLAGLVEAFSLLEQESIRKVAVVNADILSRKTSRHDRNSFP